MSSPGEPFAALFALVTRHTGLTFPEARRGAAVQGAQRAMARAGVDSPAGYLALLKARPEALQDLVDELTIGETYFFREPGQVELLRRLILPELRRRGPHSPLRVWSAGCATGEEPYSLAILLEQEGLADQAWVLGTDISAAALARGRAACYREWSLRGPGAALVRPYLRTEGDQLRLDERIRRRVHFRQLNLVEESYPSLASGIWDMDLILCRNVLIYLEPQAVARVTARLYEALAPGGWLLPGPSDPLLGELAPLQTVSTEHGLVYRRPRAEGPLPEDRGAGAGETGVMPVLAQKETGRTSIPPLPPLPETREPGSAEGPLEPVRQAVAAGDYRLAAERAQALGASLPAAVLRVRALANVDAEEALRACAEALDEHALAIELHHLHSVLLLELGRLEEAELAVRRALYLDPTLPLAHFTLGAIRGRLGDRDGALRGYTQAQTLAALRPPEEPLLSGEETAGSLLTAVSSQLFLLAQPREAP